MRDKTKLKQHSTLFWVCIILIATLFVVSSGFWYPGLYPSQTARILLNDGKTGDRALALAIFWGDSILEPLKKQSENFENLGARNSIWIAEYFIKHKSERSKELLRDIFNAKSDYTKLVASVGLAAQGVYPEEINDTAYIVRVARRETPPENKTKYWPYSSYVDLAVIALGETRNKEALPYLLEVKKYPTNYRRYHLNIAINKVVSSSNN